MEDHDTKDKLPVHIILGASELAKLKTEKLPRVELPGQLVAELTRYGWTIIPRQRVRRCIKYASGTDLTSRL